MKPWRKEGASVRKCHKDHEMLVSNNSEEAGAATLSQRKPGLGTGYGLACLSKDGGGAVHRPDRQAEARW